MTPCFPTYEEFAREQNERADRLCPKRRPGCALKCKEEKAGKCPIKMEDFPHYTEAKVAWEAKAKKEA